MIEADYIIVGSGLSGAVIARTLSDYGLNVLVVERRDTLGGNVHDELHSSGIRFHTYGPHLFRTSSEAIWQFVHRFSNFYPYVHRVLTLVDGNYEQWPLGHSAMKRLAEDQSLLSLEHPPRNFEEACLVNMPKAIYEKFVKEYTQKQWGVPADTLDAQLAKRFDVRKDDDPRFMKKRFQGMPEEGYAALMKNMLKGVPVILNCDYLKHRREMLANKLLIYTGAIDDFFERNLGQLSYRGHRRRLEYLADIETALPAPVINNPAIRTGAHVRTIEWKQMLKPEHAAQISGTLISEETPFTPTNPDNYAYPFPDRENQKLYRGYRQQAATNPKLLICGRLGEYRYYDMDQAIARALVLTQRIVGAAGYERAVDCLQSAVTNVQRTSNLLKDISSEEEDLIISSLSRLDQADNS